MTFLCLSPILIEILKEKAEMVFLENILTLVLLSLHTFTQTSLNPQTILYNETGFFSFTSPSAYYEISSK